MLVVPAPACCPSATASASGAIQIAWGPPAPTNDRYASTALAAGGSVAVFECGHGTQCRDVSAPVTGYLVQRSTDQTAWTTLATVGATTHDYVATGLTLGQTYHFRVVARTAFGSVPPSALATATAGRPPSAPRNVAARASWGRGLVDFSLPASDGGLRVREVGVFEVRRGVGEPEYETLVANRTYADTWCDFGGCHDELKLSPTPISFTPTGGHPLLVVQYVVRVRNDAGWGPASPVVWVLL